jgi:uncharacterized protein (TIGR02271 family)
MISTHELDRLEGATVYDSDGDKVGTVEQIYLDDETGTPSWVTVNTGLFGTSESFVPLQKADFTGQELRVGYDKETIKDAPRIEDADRHLERTEEDALYRYYGLSAPGAETAYADETGTPTQAPVEPTATGTVGDESAVTRSEERLEVGKERVQTGAARLRKYTTTETESVDVPVTKEKLVVERSPASGTAAAGGIVEEGEQVEEVTLSEERVRVEKETVPVEEVRIGKETVTEHQQVDEQVRKEHVEVEGDVDTTLPEER